MFLGSKVRRVRRADNLTTIWADYLVNVGSLTSHNPIDLHGMLHDSFTFFFTLLSINDLNTQKRTPENTYQGALCNVPNSTKSWLKLLPLHHRVTAWFSNELRSRACFTLSVSLLLEFPSLSVRKYCFLDSCLVFGCGKQERALSCETKQRPLVGVIGQCWTGDRLGGRDHRFTEVLRKIVAHSSVVFKALCYKPESRGFETRWSEFLNLPNPSGRIRPWGLLSH
jgi:hypothetical protein